MVAWTLKTLKRVLVAVIGGSVIVLGIAMIFLPGPAVVVIPAGLAILATEFIWARKLLLKARERASSLWNGKQGNPCPENGCSRDQRGKE